MARSASPVLALGLALTTACPTTLELGAHEGATGEEVAASESGGTSATDSGGESSGGSASGDSGSVDSTSSADTGGESSGESSGGSETDTGTSTETDTGTDTGGSETGGGLCDIDGSESPCQICIEQLCCAQLENCAQEGSCLCMVDCIEGDEDPVTCGAQCAPGLSYFEFVQCQAASCAAACI